MSPSLRRGKWMFVGLATLIVFEQVVYLGSTLANTLDGLDSIKAVLRPVLNILAIYFLGRGHEWLRWVVGGLYVLMGVPFVYVGVRVLLHLNETTPPESTGMLKQILGFPLGLFCAIGLLHILAGIPFFISPSMLAYLRFRQEQRLEPTPANPQ